MDTIGVIGLGVMGRPMARNLLQAGHAVVVANRSPAKVEALAAEGATPASDPADLAARSDVVVTCLPDAPDVEAVVLGEGGVLSALRPGGVLIDTSTVRPATARSVAEAAAARDVHAVDAPVSGGEQGAIDATLSIMVGGQDAAVEAARPVLATLGSRITHVGPAGAGQTVKAVNQLLVGGALGVLAEAVTLLEACDLDVDTALQALGGGLAGSAILQAKGPMMAHRSFTPGFRADLHHKDLGISLETARERDVPLPVTAVTAQLLAAATARGDGPLDHAAVLRTLLALAGREDEDPPEGAP